jgi:hypothetical protein
MGKKLWILLLLLGMTAPAWADSRSVSFRTSCSVAPKIGLSSDVSNIELIRDWKTTPDGRQLLTLTAR